jgi:hypothetical protein
MTTYKDRPWLATAPDLGDIKGGVAPFFKILLGSRHFQPALHRRPREAAIEPRLDM